MGNVGKKTGHRTETNVTLEQENLPGENYQGGMFSPSVNRAQRRSKPKKIRRYLKGQNHASFTHRHDDHVFE